MAIFDILEKVKKTISILTAPVIALVALWKGKDISLYIGATAALLISIIDYVELFIKK
jgi:hypothetical protein